MSKRVFALIAMMSLGSNVSANTEKESDVLSNRLAQDLKLEASEKDSRATLTTHYSWQDSFISLGVSGRLNDSEGQFIDRSGLNNKAEVSLGFSQVFPSKVEVDHVEITKLRVEQIKAQRKVLENCKKEADLRAADQDIFCKKQSEELSRLLKPIKSPDELNSLSKYEFFSLKAKFNEENFSHYDLGNLKPLKQTEEGYELSISYGQVNAIDGFRWEVGASYQEGFAFSSSNPQTNVCVPITGSSATKCFETRLSGPSKTERLVPSVSLSKLRKNDDIVKAVSAKISYLDIDTESPSGKKESDSKFLVEVPVYFFSGKSNDFRGGLNISWLSKTNAEQDKLNATIFFGKAFDLFE